MTPEALRELADKLVEFGSDMLDECNTALPSGDAWGSVVEANGLMTEASRVLRALAAQPAAPQETVGECLRCGGLPPGEASSSGDLCHCSGDDASREAAKRMSVRGPSPAPPQARATPPTADPEPATNSRSIQRRKAIMRGEPMPTFDKPPADCEALERLAAFGRDVLVQFFNDGAVGDCDGAWLEEKAHEHGLTEEAATDDGEMGWRPQPAILAALRQGQEPQG